MKRAGLLVFSPAPPPCVGGDVIRLKMFKRAISQAAYLTLLPDMGARLSKGTIKGEL